MDPTGTRDGVFIRPPTVGMPLLLQANSGINNEVNLFWNPYTEFEYPNFEIYRSTSGGSFILMANVSNSTYAYTDLNPPSEDNFYQVRVSRPNGCNPERSDYHSSRSNIIKTSSEFINEKVPEISLIYPNLVKDQLTVKHGPFCREVTISSSINTAGS